VKNENVRGYKFLSGMYVDNYFPNQIVDEGVTILERLCQSIEREQPESLEGLYVLTHSATEEFNDLAEKFEEAESEIETVAREVIAEDFEVIAKAYGFADADIEELIAPRDW
jgi:hypothetical protein